MDPVTLAIITTLFALATGGGATVVVRRQRRQMQRRRLKQDLNTRRPVGGSRVSIFDVFWDLGASDFALEMMARDGLIPDDEGDRQIELALSQLEDVVAQHGNYQEFLEDSLDAIQQFYDEHRRAGNRRRLPSLKAAARRVIPVRRRLETDNRPPATRDSANTSTDPTESTPPSASTVHQRRKLRTGHRAPGLRTGHENDEIDLDGVGDVKAMDILQSLIDGGLGHQLEKWWKMRKLRKRRDELDDALRRLYDFYADTARREPNFYDPLYDAHHRWRDETERLKFTVRRRPWASRSYAMAADVLFELAIELSEQLANSAYASTHRTIETIHDYAAGDDTAMAGYLVYLNRHAFFAGRHPDYADLARKVEYATQKVRDEIVRLQDEGVL